MIITKKYLISESVFVTKYALQSLTEHYYQCYPKNIEHKINDLINELDRVLENKHVLPNEDVKEYQLYEKITYEKNKNLK